MMNLFLCLFKQLKIYNHNHKVHNAYFMTFGQNRQEFFFQICTYTIHYLPNAHNAHNAHAHFWVGNSQMGLLLVFALGKEGNDSLERKKRTAKKGWQGKDC